MSRFVWKPVLLRGKWIVQKVPFDPKVYDTYSTRSAAKIVCARNAKLAADRAVADRQLLFQRRLLTAIKTASPEELSLLRDWAIRIVERAF